MESKSDSGQVSVVGYGNVDGERDAHVDTTDGYDKFVVPNGSGDALSSFSAVRRDSARGASRKEVTAIRIPNGDTFAKTIHFCHDLPPSLAKRINVWLS